ncbi:acetoacetate--CoA ligase, partial [Candidatus Peregrinibacteria bacterium]|nr:acetoacetate--CoA ligase [Candidatus Peregrinibacteria bacterium]
MEGQHPEGMRERESVAEPRAVASCADGVRQEVRETLDPRRILWQPSPEQIAQSNIAAFVRYLAERYGNDAPSIECLYEWSIEKPEEFWRSFLRFSNIFYVGDDMRVLTYAPHPTAPHPNPSTSASHGTGHGPPPVGEGKRRMIDARWFPDIRLNFAENILRHAEDHPEKEAITFFGEDGRERRLTFDELKQDVVRFSQLLDTCDVQRGDRVVAYMPNIPEAISAMLATTARGAIWSSASTELGADIVVDRFGQLEPKLLIAADGHLYRGKAHDALPKVQEIRQRIPSIEHTIIVPYVSERSAPHPNPLPRGEGISPLSYDRLPFDHPLFILFSSGTEGKPKCIVHGAGGTLLNQIKQHMLNADLTERDTFFFHTQTSWMMWNSLACALGTGAKVVLYDGDPIAREGRILFDIAEKERMTVFGTSASFLKKIEDMGLRPRSTYDLSALRTILSTGSTLYGSQFDYVYEHVHPAVQLSSTSGGTDVAGALATGSPILPVHREELQTLSLGYKVEVFDDDGHPLPPGEKGELVCTAPFPSQPICFWNDPDDEKRLKAYHAKYGPAIWHHGDTVELTPSGGMVIHDRSDDIIKIGGVRIGSAEIT